MNEMTFVFPSTLTHLHLHALLLMVWYFLVGWRLLHLARFESKALSRQI
jgi:hypothetical protein